MLAWKGLTLTVRMMLVLCALNGSARPLQHALLHDEAHHADGLNGSWWRAQCVDCEVDNLPVVPLVLQRLSTEKGFPIDLQRTLSGRLMGDDVRGTMGRAPPAFLS
jgi:hypothetical protein